MSPAKSYPRYDLAMKNAVQQYPGCDLATKVVFQIMPFVWFGYDVHSQIIYTGYSLAEGMTWLLH